MNEEFDKKFKNLIRDDCLPISSIEELMINDFEEYKIKMNKHVEDLILNEIDEKELITKKNGNGKIEDIIYVTKEKKN